MRVVKVQCKPYADYNSIVQSYHTDGVDKHGWSIFDRRYFAATKCLALLTTIARVSTFPRAFQTRREFAGLTAVDFATAGMHYARVGVTRCSYCEAEFDEWSADEDPFEAHKLVVKDCPAHSPYGADAIATWEGWRLSPQLRNILDDYPSLAQ